MNGRIGLALLGGMAIVFQWMMVDAVHAGRHGRRSRSVIVRCPSAVRSTVPVASVKPRPAVPPRPTAEQRALAAEMLATAADCRAAHLALYRVGSGTLEELIAWSRRLVETHRLIGSDQETLRKAMVEHHKFVEELNAGIQELFKVGAGDASEQDLQLCKFHLAEVKYWLVSLDQPARAPASAEQVAAGQEMLAAILRGESAHQALYNLGNETLDGAWDWSRRRVLAHQLLGTKGPELQKVLNDHLGAANSMADGVRQLRAAGAPGGSAAESALSQYHLAQAKFWLASATSDASGQWLSMDQRSAAQAMVSAAELCAQAERALFDVGVYPLFRLLRGSTRLLEAQLLLATNRTEKLAAIKSYLAREAELHDRIKSLGSTGVAGGDLADLLACRFHLAEARYRLASLNNR